MKGIAIWLLFSIALAAVSGSDRFECTAEGYKAYLEEYKSWKCPNGCTIDETYGC